MRFRKLSSDFMTALEDGGCLNPILNAVKNDSSLIMELRGDKVIVYYRGGALYTISKNETEYAISYNSAYWGEKTTLHKKYKELSENPSIEDSVKNIALYKDQMDYHMTIASYTLEKQAQQRLVLENNILANPKTTGDYFIIDIEYAFKKQKEINARFDAVALKWPSLSTDRRKHSGLGLTFIEMKYNDSSMDGVAGIQKHIEDYLALVNRPEFSKICEDMQTVFEQKCELGLIPAYTKKFKNKTKLSKEEEKKRYKVKIDPNNVDFVFMFANRDPDSIVAKRELKEVIRKHNTKEIQNIYVATSSDVGYVMFRYDEKGNVDRYIPIIKYLQ